MADITMCQDSSCPNAGQCYRYTANVSTHRQSYFVVSPLKEDKSCDEFVLDERHKILRRNK
jgi:lipoate synthase